jgi:hypothetical protein
VVAVNLPALARWEPPDQSRARQQPAVRRVRELRLRAADREDAMTESITLVPTGGRIRFPDMDAEDLYRATVRGTPINATVRWFREHYPAVEFVVEGEG